MNVLGEHQVAERLRWPDLIASLRAAFVEGVVAPGRTAHTIEVPGGSPVSLLLMPSWQVGEKIVVKLATVAPDNWKRDLPTIHGLIALLDARAGVVECLMEAGDVTAKRTAAASAPHWRIMRGRVWWPAWRRSSEVSSAGVRIFGAISAGLRNFRRYTAGPTRMRPHTR